MKVFNTTILLFFWLMIWAVGAQVLPTQSYLFKTFAAAIIYVVAFLILVCVIIWNRHFKK